MNGGTSPLTKREARRILEREIFSRDFWLVTRGTDNFNVLQDVLNLMYNSNEGNRYTVKYCKGQNITRLVVYCEICHKELTSYDPFVAHDKGKHHKKAVQVANTLENANSSTYDSFEFRDPQLPLNIFQKGSLEDKIDNSTSCVIGLQFVYKELYKETLLFTCQLCLKEQNCFRISSREMYCHLTHDFHTLNYMSSVYGFKDCSVAGIRDEIENVVEHEGRITCDIVLLSYDERRERPREGGEEDPSSHKRPRHKSSSLASSDRKRHKKSDSGSLPPSAKLVDQECQASLFAGSISEFVDELRNCVEEEHEITSLLQETKPEHQSVFLNAVKVLSKGMLHFFALNADKEFEKMCREFVDLTLKL